MFSGWTGDNVTSAPHRCIRDDPDRLAENYELMAQILGGLGACRYCLLTVPKARKLPIVFLSLLGLTSGWAVPAARAGVTAKGSCVVVAKDVAKGKSEFGVTCNRDIANGTIFIDVNRSVRSGNGRVTVSQPAGGTLTCTLNHVGMLLRLDCEGSLLANTTARLVSPPINMFTVPCDLPVFKGTVTIRFGDGSSFGPRPLSPYRCLPRTHIRRFSQFDSGSTPQGQGFIGSLAPKDGFTRCARNAPIRIQRRVGSRWRTVKRTKTQNPSRMPPRGYGFTGIVGTPGTYRAYAPRLRFGNQVCPAVVSRSSG